MQFKLFPAYFDHPENMRFAEQEEDEVIELFLRQHFIVNIGWVISALIALILPPLVLQLDLIFRIDLIANLPIKLVLESIMIWYLLLSVFVLEKFLYWYFNIFIVTNIHIINVSFSSILSRQITEIELGDIESVSSTVSGLLGSLFNYGDLIIETAAKDKSIDFRKIPKPDLVADRVQDLRFKVRKGEE